MDIIQILDELSKKIVISLSNNIYNGTYKYTLNRYRDTLRQIVLQSEYKTIITNEIIDNYLINKMQTEYVHHIKNMISSIEKIPIVEQKSPDWFRLREDIR
jgi:hypothetical protein